MRRAIPGDLQLVSSIDPDLGDRITPYRDRGGAGDQGSRGDPAPALGCGEIEACAPKYCSQ
jgi:hypothetical protein